LLGIIVVFAQAAALAQQGTAGAVSGVVLDASGAPVPDAAVEVVNATLGSRRSATTSNVGLFSVGNLAPDDGYTVTVIKAGFAEYKATRIEILLGQDVFLNVKLELVQLQTRIEVEGSPIVEANKIGVSQVVESAQTLHLPING